MKRVVLAGHAVRRAGFTVAVHVVVGVAGHAVGAVDGVVRLRHGGLKYGHFAGVAADGAGLTHADDELRIAVVDVGGNL